MTKTLVLQLHFIVVLDILKIKDLTTNRDCKKPNKQDIRYYSIDSNRPEEVGHIESAKK